jgi:hypothetical protein
MCEQIKVERRGKKKYFYFCVKDAIQIKLHPDNIKRREGFKLCKAWNPSTSFIKALQHTYITKIPRSRREKNAKKGNKIF